MKNLKSREEFLNESDKESKENKTVWIRASELKIGDRILDQNDNKISTIRLDI